MTIPLHAASALPDWFGEFDECRCAAPLLERASLLEIACRHAVRESELTLTGQRFFQLRMRAAAAVLTMPQAQLALYCSPERRHVSIRLSTQRHQDRAQDPYEDQVRWLRAQLLVDNLAAYFKPRRTGATPPTQAPRTSALASTVCWRGSYGESRASRLGVGALDVGTSPRARAPDERSQGADVLSSRYASEAKVMFPTALR